MARERGRVLRARVDGFHALVGGARAAEVRDRRAGLDRIRRVHLHVAARHVPAARENPAVRDDRHARPVQVAGVLRGRGPLRISHRGPRETETVVLEIAHEGVVAIAGARAGRVVDEGEKPEAVPDLVQHDRHEIDPAAGGAAVEAVVPRVRERAGRTDRAVERGPDVVLRRGKVRARELVRERLRIPGARDRRPGEVGVKRLRTRLSEHRARRTAGERVHIGPDSDGHRARELRAPQIRRVLERVQALRAERDTGVATDRRGGRRIVETLARAVEVDDGDGRRVACAEAEQQGERREEAVDAPDARHSAGVS